MPIDPLGWLDDASDALAGALASSSNSLAAMLATTGTVATTAGAQAFNALYPAQDAPSRPPIVIEPVGAAGAISWVTFDHTVTSDSARANTCEACRTLARFLWPPGTAPHLPIHTRCRCVLVRQTVALPTGYPPGTYNLPHPIRVTGWSGGGRHTIQDIPLPFSLPLIGDVIPVPIPLYQSKHRTYAIPVDMHRATAPELMALGVLIRRRDAPKDREQV